MDRHAEGIQLRMRDRQRLTTQTLFILLLPVPTPFPVVARRIPDPRPKESASGYRSVKQISTRYCSPRKSREKFILHFPRTSLRLNVTPADMRKQWNFGIYERPVDLIAHSRPLAIEATMFGLAHFEIGAELRCVMRRSSHSVPARGAGENAGPASLLSCN